MASTHSIKWAAIEIRGDAAPGFTSRSSLLHTFFRPCRYAFGMSTSASPVVEAEGPGDRSSSFRDWWIMSAWTIIPFLIPFLLS